MQEVHPFTLSVFTENKIGLLLRITTVFTRRHINIESLTTSESEIPGIHRFVIVIRVTEDQVIKLKKQLDKIIGVIKAFVLREEEVVHQELAMYKVSNQHLEESDFERIVRDNHARVLHFGKDHIMLEKTGHPGETLELLKLLEPYGVMGFSRTGVIAIAKKPLNLRAYVEGELTE